MQRLPAKLISYFIEHAKNALDLGLGCNERCVWFFVRKDAEHPLKTNGTYVSINSYEFEPHYLVSVLSLLAKC